MMALQNPGPRRHIVPPPERLDDGLWLIQRELGMTAVSLPTASFAVELQGMAGVDLDAGFGFQEAYLSSPGFRLAGGTDEIMRNILSERVLGLPAEPRADKGMAFKDIPTGPAKS